MAAVARQPGLPSQTHSHLHSTYNDDDANMSTILDPRTRTASPANVSEPASPHHPDLHNEVATLSNKLINAINHQTNLDDTLSATRHELKSSQERVRQLEKERSEHAQQISQGLLVPSSVMQVERQKLLASLAEEKRQRLEAEKAKKKMENELENLTAALFEEANKMVIVTREQSKTEQDAMQRKNEQLKTQVTDTETLLKSHQEQLAELKALMEHMGSDRDDQTSTTAPSTPGLNKFFSKDDSIDGPHAARSEDVTPTYPTSLTHLLSPVLRTDVAAYDDFTSLLRSAKLVSQPGSRVSSGSYGGLGLGLSLGGSSQSAVSGTSSNATSSLANALGNATGNGSPTTPTTPASATFSNPGTSTPNLPMSLPLKETRFYKRALAEDIDPTLRLDTAPGLSWLARRSVLNAMCDGTLIVEPMPLSSTAKYLSFACSLCGETRKDAEHTRTHRFRTSESDSAQRYPLCKYCLGRVRSTCDFLGFLRLLKDGHWRTEDEESEKTAWEESVRLREQMFWCRMGGGVVPVVSQHHHNSNGEKSPRTTTELERDREMLSSLTEEFEIVPKDITPAAPAMPPMPAVEAVKPDIAGNTAFLKKRRELRDSKKHSTYENAAGLWTAAQEDAEKPVVAQETVVDDGNVKGEAQESQELDVKKVQTFVDPVVEEQMSHGEQVADVEAKRLSHTIPGSFD